MTPQEKAKKYTDGLPEYVFRNPKLEHVEKAFKDGLKMAEPLVEALKLIRKNANKFGMYKIICDEALKDFEDSEPENKLPDHIAIW